MRYGPSVRSTAKRRPLSQGSDPASYPTKPPASYRANRPLPGRDFHPQGERALRGRTEETAPRSRTKKRHEVGSPAGPSKGGRHWPSQTAKRPKHSAQRMTEFASFPRCSPAKSFSRPTPRDCATCPPCGASSRACSRSPPAQSPPQAGAGNFNRVCNRTAWRAHNPGWLADRPDCRRDSRSDRPHTVSRQIDPFG